MSSEESEPLLHDYAEPRHPGPERFVNEQCASLTYTGSLSAITWRKHLIANWGKFKEGLTEVKLLIVCGVHGRRDGSISGDANNVRTCENQLDFFRRQGDCTAEVLDLKTCYDGDSTNINECLLVDNVRGFRPNLIVFSICFSNVSKVKNMLERSGLLAEQKLERNLIAATNGKIIDLDEKQVELIAKVADPGNINKNIVIQGPEGSGKTLLGIEIVKVLVNNYIYTKNLSPEQAKKDIRVIFSACYHQPDEVKFLLTQVKPMMERGLNCNVAFEPIEAAKKEENPQAYNGDRNLILELIRKDRSYGNYEKTIILIDELSPGFETSHWEMYDCLKSKGVKDVQIVFNLKYDFHDMKVRRELNEDDERDYNEVDILPLKNVLVGRLQKAYRCSNEIRKLVYFLLMHDFGDDNFHQFKSFEHMHDVRYFDPDRKPIWIETIDAKSFFDFIRHNRQSVLGERPGETVLIYDPETIDSQAKSECDSIKWKYVSMTEAVGIEFSTVIIYGLREFHFEAFTRALNQLIIVTTSRSRGKLTSALNEIKDNKHQDEQCRLNCEKNGKYFKLDDGPYCMFRKTTGGKFLGPGPKSLLKCGLGNPTSTIQDRDNRDISVTDDNGSWSVRSDSKWMWFYIICVLIFLVIVVLAATGQFSSASPFPSGNYIIVVTGLLYDSGKHTEIVDLSNHGFNCDLPDFPLEIAYAAGGIVNGIPTICGGAYSNISQDDGSETILDKNKYCYAFQNRSWNKMGKSLVEPKFYFGTGNVVMKDKLLIHGGLTKDIQDTTFSFAESSEWIGSNTKSSPLDTFPAAVGSHCNIRINKTHFMMTGGMVPLGNAKVTNRTKVTGNTYYCQMDLKCSPGPRLKHPRKSHGCYQKSISGKQYLFVIGGYIRNHIPNSTHDVEYLDMSDASKRQWELDYVQLNFAKHGHTIITTLTGKGEEKEEIYLIGGLNIPTHFSGSAIIYKLNKVGRKKTFTSIPTKLKFGRAYHIALPISDEFAKESCQGHWHNSFETKKVSSQNQNLKFAIQNDL